MGRDIYWVGKMAHQVKVLVAKSDDLSLILEPTRWKSYSALLTSMHTVCTQAHIHTPQTKFIHILFPPTHDYYVISAHQESLEYSHCPSEVNTYPVNSS